MPEEGNGCPSWNTSIHVSHCGQMQHYTRAFIDPVRFAGRLYNVNASNKEPDKICAGWVLLGQACRLFTASVFKTVADECSKCRMHVLFGRRR
jgi:hypothetical protein